MKKKKSCLKHGSLFSGTGGWTLGASWAGIETKWHSEIEPYCRKVLKQNYPKAKLYGDIKEMINEEIEKVDILTVSPSCQPQSLAGSRRGDQDERYLWEESLAIIKRVRAPYVVIENVYGLVTLGLSEWLDNLETEGYSELQTYVIPAAGIGAPHRRDRVWIIAVSNDKSGANSKDNSGTEERQVQESGENIGGTDLPDAISQLSQESKTWTREQKREYYAASVSILPNTGSPRCEQQRWTVSAREKFSAFKRNCCKRVRQWLSFTRVGIANDGVSSWLRSLKREWYDPSYYPEVWLNNTWEKEITRTTGGTNIPENRKAMLKALGNSVVPQIPYRIFEAIKAVEEKYEDRR